MDAVLPLCTINEFQYGRKPRQNIEIMACTQPSKAPPLPREVCISIGTGVLNYEFFRLLPLIYSVRVLSF